LVVPCEVTNDGELTRCRPVSPDDVSSLTSRGAPPIPGTSASVPPASTIVDPTGRNNAASSPCAETLKRRAPRTPSGCAAFPSAPRSPGGRSAGSPLDRASWPSFVSRATPSGLPERCSTLPSASRILSGGRYARLLLRRPSHAGHGLRGLPEVWIAQLERTEELQGLARCITEDFPEE
jgi:hypothetical protein